MTKNIDDLSPKQRELLELLLKERQEKKTQSQIKPVARSGESYSFPLSFAQQRLWFLDQVQPGNPSYNLPFSRWIKGPLDVAALERSINEINRRHETLRTHFLLVEGNPVQVVSPPQPSSLAVEDLGGLAADQKEAEVQKIVAHEARRPFDLATGPLSRARLLRLGEQEHVLMLTMHHIISDAWSMGVLVRELGLLYEAFTAGKPSPLSELPIQYADFAVWQREWLRGEVLREQLEYWKKQLEGIPTALELQTDRPRPPVLSYRGATLSFQYSAELSKALNDLSRREDVTLYLTLLAAFKVLLHRYTGQEDIAVGAPIANRNRVEAEGLTGFFANTLVMRTDLSGNPPFKQLLQRVRTVALDAYAHQDMPFEKLVEELAPERALNRQPLFQVMFVLQNAPSQPLELPGLTVETLSFHTGTSKFDLHLSMREAGDHLTAVLEYSTDIFDESTVKRMMRHFENLLREIVANPEMGISQLPLISDEERRQLLVESNNTRAEYPHDKTVIGLFEEQVEHNREATAVESAGERVSYSELNRRANQLAHYLRREGARAETLVGICMLRGVEMMVAVLGVLKSGAAYVPLDPTSPKERLSYMMEDSNVLVLLTQQSLLEILPDNSGRVVCLDACQDALAKESTDNPPRSTTAENLLYVTYTSGSTGKPKGIAMTQRPLLNLLEWMRRTTQLPDGARTVQFASLSFDVSFQDMFSTWLSGGTLVLISEAERQDIPALAGVLTERQVNRIFIPAVALQQLAEGFFSQEQFSTNLKRIIAGSEQLQITDSIEAFFKLAKDCSLHNEYGPSETHVVTALGLAESPDLWPARPPVGRPISNTQIYLVDSFLQPVPIGVLGELYIGGVNLARGYMGRPDLTAERFVPDPFSAQPGARLYKTGDLARYLADGNIEFIGRMDNQVKIRGYRIELGEIEAVLNQHPQVRECVVMAEPDKSGSNRLIAYIVAAGETAPKVEELRSFLRQKLPEYMVPSAFVSLDAMPLTPGRKIDRRALPSMTGIRPDLEAAFVPPRNKMEKSIAEIWKQVLGLEQVGVHDNFFDLGGHSLLMGQVFDKLQKIVDGKLSMVELLEHPTISSLARFLNKDKGGQPAVKRSDEGVEKLKEGKSRLQQQFRQRQLGRRKPGK
jgi:amino acid adenylation domain-containing protein